MAAALHLFSGLILVLVSLQVCLGDDDDNSKHLPDLFGDSLTGMTGLFQGLGDGLKERAEGGMDAFKGLSSGVQEGAEEGVETAKGWAEGLGDGMTKARDSLMDAGDNIKKVLGDAALTTKEEVESAASKISKHAKEASDSMFKMLG